MKIHEFIIGVILISAISIGIIGYVTDLSKSHGATADLSGLNATQNRINATMNLTEELKNDISELSSEDTALYEYPYHFLKVGIQSIKLTFNSFGTLFDMVEDFNHALTGRLTIPGWVMGVIEAVILLSLVFAVVYALLKWKVET